VFLGLQGKKEKFRYFSGFLLLCKKILFWELKEVLFALFPLSKLVFNTSNKNLSKDVNLCSAVDTTGPTVYLLLIYFQKIIPLFPLRFRSNFSP
jgi:hypothetical protein